MTIAHVCAAVLVAVIWGFNFVVIRWGLNDVPPLTLTVLRFALASFPALLVVRRPRVPWTRLASYGLFTFALQFSFLFGGIHAGLPAGLASVVIQVQVYFTVGLAMLVAHERPAPAQIAGALLAGSGVLLVALNLPGGGTRSGLLLVLLAAAAWAVANLIVKRIALQAGDSALGIVIWASAYALVPLALAAALIDGPARMVSVVAHLAPAQWAGVAFQAWPTTLLAFGLWAWLLRRYPAALVAPFALLVPVVGLASAAWLLGEAITWWKLAAAALVIAGLALNVLTYRRA